MKIPASARYELVYSVSSHPHLGSTIEAYVVQLTSAGNMSMVHQRIHARNADFYHKKMAARDYEALTILDECLPEYIVKRFSKVKKIRPSEYFSKHFDKVVYEKQIRPHIEKRLAKVMELIKGRQLFLKKAKKRHCRTNRMVPRTSYSVISFTTKSGQHPLFRYD